MSVVRFSVLSLVASLLGCGIDSPSSSKPVSGDIDDGALEFSTDLSESPDGAYLVNFRGDFTMPSAASGGFFAETRHFYSQLTSQFLSDPRVTDLDYLHHMDFNQILSDRPFAAEFGTPGFLQRSLGSSSDVPTVGVLAKVNFRNESDARAALGEWYSRGQIWFAEPDRRSTPDDGPFDGYVSRYNNISGCNEDPPSKYWLERIGWFQAMAALNERAASAETPIIAVMDSGVDFDHSYLNKNAWHNTRKQIRGCDDDEYGCNTTVGKKGKLGNGDIRPFALQSNGKCPSESNRCDSKCCHGTHVAGIVAGFDQADETLKMGGVCPMCQILAIRVMGIPKNETTGTILDSSIIRGFKYLTYFSGDGGFGVRVVNASFGKFQRSRAISLLIRLLQQVDNGVLVIGAAGNEDSMKPNFPGGYNDAISVSNISESGEKHLSSNFGRWVDIAAPGDRICSTVPGGGFEKKSGTSMAAPVVAGAAGLLLAIDPTLSYKRLRERLLLTADPSIYQNKVNSEYARPLHDIPVPLLGTGMVNVENAIKNTDTSTIPLVGALDRVTTSCGEIGGHDRRNSLRLILILLAPIGIGAFIRRFRRQHKDPE